MLKTVILKNQYMDSIALMLLTNAINELPGVLRASVMMGTPANQDILRQTGFDTAEMKKAGPNDMLVVYEAENGDVYATVQAAIDAAVKGPQQAAGAQGMPTVHSWAEVSQTAQDSNLCLLSVPGEYAADEAEAALQAGKHAFIFSDNVSVQDEKRLKELAHEKGLLVMGPDCGTGIIGGLPLAFANVVRRGSIGVAGASGTGLQEVTVAIHRLGGGVSHAIGTGGRDLSAEVGAITMMDALCALEEDAATEVIVMLTKPPAKEVMEKVTSLLQSFTKPVVALFLGQGAAAPVGNVHTVATMQAAAEAAVRLGGGSVVETAYETPNAMPGAPLVKGLFSGGTLASEMALLLRWALDLPDSHADGGVVMQSENCEILDLGDDVFTQGRPHPMIDATGRRRAIRELGEENRPLVVLLDVVLGHGAAENPARDIAAAIQDVLERRCAKGLATAFVANVVGTDDDPQGLESQRTILEQAGAKVFMGNMAAARYALGLVGAAYKEPAVGQGPAGSGSVQPWGASQAVKDLLAARPKVLNIGLQGFANELQSMGASVTHFAWRPVAGGDKRLRRALDYLAGLQNVGPYKSMEEANRAVVEKVLAGQAVLVDVVPAKTAAPVLDGKVLLHAGPPIKWENMTHPMQGSCVGAALFEGWADTEEDAWNMLHAGEVQFVPCHHVDFVGPMGGITSGNMPVMKMENRAGGNVAYCTINEGLGAVLRYGAYGPDVVERLRFLRDEMGPVMAKALHEMEDGLNINVIMGKAIAMGDEFHQRNTAASLIFTKEMTLVISGMNIPDVQKQKILTFMGGNEQFFLNVIMAAGKCIMDYAATEQHGTVVTVMSRNGENFGVRIAGMQQEWFTAPVNTPVGMYFAGYTAEDGNPDIGDSAITETLGVGGMAMVASPAVTRFVGSGGGLSDALATSNEMAQICMGHNGQLAIPNWDFQGALVGIDACKVVQTGILPVINTGIAHKKAGVGQVGAGTVNPPMACFAQAVLAYAKKLGFQDEG